PRDREYRRNGQNYVESVASMSSGKIASQRWTPDKILLQIMRLDRDRGAPHDAAPPTPPGIGVPTSAVREVALTCTQQGLKAERSEVCVGKPHREGFAPC